MTRTKNSIKNLRFSLSGLIIDLIITFATRVIFVRVLNAEYLGVNGLFLNIISILSFTELGIGTAIVFSMYKPLALNEEEKINSLMGLYKKAYLYIGIIILVLGLFITPYLDFFVKDLPDISNLEIIFILFLLNTSISYFFSYKRSLLIADQKKYIDSKYHYAFSLLKNIFQILILIYTKDYILFLLIQLSVTFVENVTISIKVNRLYPFLNTKKTKKIDKVIFNEISRNIKALILHKLGGVLVMGTDNILISKYIGLVTVGIYSNYVLIIGTLKKVFNIGFQSIVASIGNLGATESTEKNEYIFDVLDFVGYWIYGFSSVALITLFNPFIKLWLGKEYIFPISSVILIVISFYLTGRRSSVMSFREALGLFWYDRYKPIFESIINLTTSIILLKVIGFNGVIIGTIISTITTCFWVEPYILYKYGLKASSWKYFKRYFLETVLLVIIAALNYLIVGRMGNSFYGFISKMFITLTFPNALIMLLFWKNRQFQYLFDILKRARS